MPRPIFALCALSFLAGVLQAADLSGPAEPMTTSVQKEPIKTFVPIYRAFVNTDSDKFTFVMPENSRLGGDPAHGHLQIVNAQDDYSISFTIFRPVAVDSQESLKAVYRTWLADRHPGSKIREEFSRPVLGRNALGFDLDWKTAAGLAQKTRAIYAVIPAGLLEVTVTSGTKTYPAAVSGFNEVAASLVESVNGKLEFTHLVTSGL